jgi:hypothetical protein
VTDVSSKGLIPQLTDLLYALADSHELLLFKLQDVRRQRNDAGRMIIDQPFHTESIDLADSRLPARVDTPALADTMTGEKNGAQHVTLTDEIRRVPEPADLASTRSDVSPVVGDDRTSRAQPETPSPSHAPSEIVMLRRDRDTGTPAQPLTPPEPSADVGRQRTDGASADRNYNFFDELDARLTHVRSLDTGPDERGSS